MIYGILLVVLSFYSTGSTQKIDQPYPIDTCIAMANQLNTMPGTRATCIPLPRVGNDVPTETMVDFLKQQRD